MTPGPDVPSPYVGGDGSRAVSTPGSRLPRGEWWRTLDELADDPAFRERLYNEFPSEIEAIADPVARRTFLKLMGASMALAGVTACTRQPAEKIVPYVRQPEEIVPGRPLFYATAMALGGVVTGLLVESHEGRPTKIEGNPLHPGSLGATDVFAQAAVLGLYDPDRSQTLTSLGEIRPWSAFLGTIRAALSAQQTLKGAGLRLLTESVSSPTLAAQIHEALERYPSAKWHQWDPASHDNARVPRRAVPPGSRGRHRRARRRFSGERTRGPAVRARLQRAAAAGACRPYEPPLRFREHADVDRLARRSPATAGAA
jgi:MoCo/4Fe-4S cofactor protein with predicted Tat translocation signal